MYKETPIPDPNPENLKILQILIQTVKGYQLSVIGFQLKRVSCNNFPQLGIFQTGEDCYKPAS